MYFYEKLTINQRSIYDQILNAINQMQPTIYLSGKNLRLNSLNAILDMIMNDNPDIFWVERKFRYTTETKNKNLINSYFPIYRLNMTQRKSMEEEILKNEHYFLSGIRFSMTPYEKALRIYENMPRLIKYDKEAISGKRKEKRKDWIDDCSTIYGVFVLGKAVCEGYAKAYQYLLHKCGVECLIVNGNTSGFGHCWNMIYLERAWYHVDVTWGDLLESFTDGYISYAWFGLTDRDVLRSRTIDNGLAYPSCNSSECNYYIRNKSYFYKWDPQSLESCIRRLIKANQYRKVQLRFFAFKDMKEAWEYLISNNRIFDLYKEEKIIPGSIWHSMDEKINILTIWTQYKKGIKTI